LAEARGYFLFQNFGLALGSMHSPFHWVLGFFPGAKTAGI